jgi:hypothetical protein
MYTDPELVKEAAILVSGMLAQLTLDGKGRRGIIDISLERATLKRDEKLLRRHLLRASPVPIGTVESTHLLSALQSGRLTQ